MEDDDSAILQSSTIEDSGIVTNSSTISDVLLATENLLENDDDLDALSSLSEDGVSTGSTDNISDDYESDSHIFDEEDVLFSTSALHESSILSNNRTKNSNNCNNAMSNDLQNQPITEKKKLSIDDALVDLHIHDVKASSEKTDLLKSLGNMFSRGKTSNKETNNPFPGTKITYKDGENTEHWEFANKSNPQNNQENQARVTSESIGPKKVLKLQLSGISSDKAEVISDETEESDGQVPASKTVNTVTHNSKGNISKASPMPNISKFMQKLLFELRDPDELQCSKWKRIFVDCNNVVVSCQPPLDGELGYDAVVIPGNSFGFLDGEPEIEYTNTFGWNLQDEFQSLIKEEHDGELVVGKGLIRPLDPCTGVKYAIYVPVMRVPLDVSESANAYLAFRAAIKTVKHHNETCMKEDCIISILCPALCNGFGGMPPARIALQMRTAYDTFAGGEKGNFLYSDDLGAMATNHVNMTTKIGKWY
ncbi:uncharacterized protein LOC120341977 [Styela clava]